MSDEIAAKELKEFTNVLLRACEDEASTWTFDKSHPQQLYAICTYGTILELTSSIVALVDAKQTISIPIIMRTLLDAFASFRCFINDPNHFKAMCASFIKEKLRLLQSITVNPGNIYLAGITTALNIDKEKVALKQQLADIEAQGYAAMKPYEEFEKANLTAEYQSLYWLLCMHAHNNASALESRHLSKRGEDYEVVFYKEINQVDLVRYLDSTCSILLDASQKLHSLLCSKQSALLQDLEIKFKEVRKPYSS